MHPRLVCAVFVLFLPLGVAADWVSEDMGDPPEGCCPSVLDINDRGQVVGTLFSDSFDMVVFVWDEGDWTILPTLGGRWAWPTGINNRGQIAGVSLTDDVESCVEYEGELYCYYFSRGFLWEDGQMQELGEAGFYSYAGGISEGGAVAGWYETAAGRVAAIWDPQGRVTPLGSSLGGWVSPEDINARGQVVGSASTGTDQHPFLWDRHAGMIDLGTLGGSTAWAMAINASGMVVGNSDTDELLDCVTREGETVCRHGRRSFIWEDGVMTPLVRLGGIYSQPGDVNDDGVVVGVSDTDEVVFCYEPEPGLTTCLYRYHAVVWQDGQVIDLGVDGQWSAAQAINNHGEIAGFAGSRPVIWRPVE